MDSATLKDFVLDLIQQSGALALKFFRTQMGVENKADQAAYDPVTAADREIEQLIRGAIAAAYPHHGIVAEEFGDHQPDARWQWYIDPIDGTRAFMSGSPLWGTLIGVAHDRVPIVGALGQPFLGEIYVAASGAGELLHRGERMPLRSRATTQLADAILYCTDPDLFRGDRDSSLKFEELSRRVLLRRFGGDCYSYAMLAAGLIDLVVEAGLKAYDIVPLIPLLEAAGAVVTDWRGNVPLQGGRVVAAATPGLHARALSVLAG